MSALADRYFEKAIDAIKRRDYDHSLGLLLECIKLKPDFAEAWACRGNVQAALSNHLEALLHFDKALEYKPDMHDVWNNRGIAFGNIGLFGAAQQSFEKSIELMNAVEPHMGLANTACTLMDLERAASEYRNAIAIDPGCLDAHVNLGVTLLGLGQWEEGFKEYEVRWHNTPMAPRAFRDYPKWHGEDLNDKTILLYPEQGYGDEIMGIRFAKRVAAKFPGAHIFLQARAPIRRLVETAPFELDGISVSDTDGFPRTDYSCPLLDVPMVLGLSWDQVISPRYLCRITGQREWLARLSTLPPGINVGLCWSSGSHFNMPGSAQAMKSIPLEWLKPLAMPGVNLVSLQKDRTDRDPSFPLFDWMDECHDFADTACLIHSLDLVISVDTAVAHLAGALGKNVLNFVRFSGYWPWLAPDVVGDPHQSIWYPSMRLLRQPSLANWDAPIRTATDWLTKLALGNGK